MIQNSSFFKELGLPNHLPQNIEKADPCHFSALLASITQANCLNTELPQEKSEFYLMFFSRPIFHNETHLKCGAKFHEDPLGGR